MAWTEPMTAVAQTVWSAAEFNTHVRDNLLQTGPGIAGAVTRAFFMQSGNNAVTTKKISNAIDLALVSTASTTYVSLAGGPAVTLTTGSTVLIVITADLIAVDVGVEYCVMSFEVSGATSIAPSDFLAITSSNDIAGGGGGLRVSCSGSYFLTTLNPGSNTFTAKYRSSTGTTAQYEYRYMTVVPL